MFWDSEKRTHMGTVIDFEEKLREKKFAQVLGTIFGLYGQADCIAQEYFVLMDENPTEAIEQLPEFMGRVRDVNPVRAYESLAGGPNQDLTGPILNIVGVVDRNSISTMGHAWDRVTFPSGKIYILNLSPPTYIGTLTDAMHEAKNWLFCRPEDEEWLERLK